MLSVKRVVVKDLKDVALSLPVNKVSQVVKTGFAYHLIRVEENKKLILRT